MKKTGLLYVALILLGLFPITSAWARGGHGGGFGGGGHGYYRGPGGFYRGYGYGLGFGFGGYGLGLGLGYGLGYGGYGFWPYYSYPPAYPPPSAVAVPAAPPVYVERQEMPQPQVSPPPNYWYYCRAPEGYYPYVKDCPDGWLQVPPQPSSQN